jgi:hypothetical protein
MDGGRKHYHFSAKTQEDGLLVVAALQNDGIIPRVIPSLDKMIQEAMQSYMERD